MSDKTTTPDMKAVAVQAVWAALETVGVYPKSVHGPGGYEERTPYHEGWNAATHDVTDKVMKALALVESADDDLTLLLVADLGWTRPDGSFVLNVNDTFYYATADCEEVPAGEVAAVARLFRRYGYHGVNYWVATRRGHNPQIPKYARGVAWVQGEEQEARR